MGPRPRFCSYALAAASAAISLSACSSNVTGARSLLSAPSTVRCNTVVWRLPRGWNGYARRHGQFFTVLLGNFRLPREQDDVGELAAKRMKAGDIRVLLLGYGSARWLPPSVFRPRSLPLRIASGDLLSYFEHLPRGHRLARKTFSAKGQALDVQVEFAESHVSDQEIATANRILRRLRITPRTHVPTTCPSASPWR